LNIVLYSFKDSPFVCTFFILPKIAWANERESAAGAMKQETSIRLRNNQNNFSITSPAIEKDKG
jgi:hypothetical protein